MDEMLGRLATWLRALGLDATLLPAGCSRVEKRILARGCVFLTRSRDFKIGRTILIKSDDPARQLEEAVEELGLDPGRLKPLSRCLRCNVVLEEISPQEAKAIAPDYVVATHKRFKRCPACRRIFWPGTHHERMSARLDDLLARPKG
ncbi:MAG: hypothetical protein JRC92_03635 [Deltaproteobacteria bacterium]|nr:hypothetical protein [Deltaproteobacteria bacterium]